jgi:hypothetical protein
MARPWPFVVLAALAAGPAAGDEPHVRTRGYVAVESRLFPEEGPSPAADRINGSIAAELELRLDCSGCRTSLVLTPFLRLDGNDPARTHFDLREAAVRVRRDDVGLLLGVSKVFWGVTESQHLVDVVNQTDLVENPDGEDKLGQPMINVTLSRRWGTLDLFVLPLSRERTFPGRSGRLGPGPSLDGGASVFEGGRWRPSFAARWSRTLGPLDLAVSHFHGTSREPRMVGATPHYDVIDQTGLETQVTSGRWLWKLEAIRRAGPASTYAAATAGFEYAMANAFGLGLDLGLLAEYLYDQRGGRATTPWQDDVFAGVRVAPNDAQGTELRAGVIVDRRTRASAWSVEGSRRIGSHWRLDLEARAFRARGGDDPLAGRRGDDYLQTELSFRF